MWWRGWGMLSWRGTRRHNFPQCRPLNADPIHKPMTLDESAAKNNVHNANNGSSSGGGDDRHTVSTNPSRQSIHLPAAVTSLSPPWARTACLNVPRLESSVLQAWGGAWRGSVVSSAGATARRQLVRWRRAPVLPPPSWRTTDPDALNKKHKKVFI